MFKSKRTIMGVAAILILIFHFYIPIFQSVSIGKNLSKLGYIGVDLFFLVSGAGIAQRKDMKALSFVGNRLKTVYCPFILFAIVSALINKWDIVKIITTISGVSLFTKGGGSFCWFFPGIMLFYILTPLLLKAKEKFSLKAFFGIILLWAALVVILQHVFGYTKIFILLHRFPIFLTGLFLKDFCEKLSKRRKTVLFVTGLVGGATLFLCYVFIIKKNGFVAEAQYLFAYPFVMSLAFLVDYLSQRVKVKFSVLAWIGGFTLELYGFQMIFGYRIIKLITGITGTNNLAFILTCILLCGISYSFSMLKRKTLNRRQV